MADRNPRRLDKEYRQMPPPNLAIGDVIQAVHRYDVDAQVCLNVFYYRVKALDTTPNVDYYDQMSTVANAIADSATGPVVGWTKLACTDLNSTWLQAQRVYPVRNPYVRVITNDPGIETPPHAPSICALSVTKRTDVVGRGRSGHTQLAGLPMAAIIDGYWSVDAVNDAEQYGEDLLAVITFGTGGELELVLYGPDRIPVSSKVEVTTPHNEVRSMHRRTVGLGI